MKELIIFNGAAKIMSAGLSTFGLAGAGAGIGIVFGCFLIFRSSFRIAQRKMNIFGL